LASTVVERNRAKISVTVDPALLKELDAYVAEHPGLDRSRVIDQALLQWYAARQDEAIAAQHQAVPSDAERREMNEWRAIRRAAAARTLRRD
jgi:metal-responsive CopG/Arc/MetJ family transcriptional regulator